MIFNEKFFSTILECGGCHVTRESSSEHLGIPTIISILNFAFEVGSVSPKAGHFLLYLFVMYRYMYMIIY